CARSDSNLDFW
nr:immunoglobulin heavy chain junction region [Macaca mulatta]MOV47422.1 immunoglobulin heavy chain junction region [Macaca mulatta]MOV47424.1 immunoglobulin heavy chain junction region [Macaca mulatta]MOV47443.1 immunoglobulin heavy chain junction region [Macaca mulatta]MOV47466.1 immunoglobulin heavy chain junction region [Macaca mulatta]